MHVSPLHSWELSPAIAREVQRRLASQVERGDRLGPVALVDGTDISVQRAERRGRAAIVLLSYPGLEVTEVALAEGPLTFPYIPGLLSFREAPLLLAAAEKLQAVPDLLVVDGQGLAHPRRCGLACHLGLLLDLPTIGCAKSRLIGQHAEPGPSEGDLAPLEDGDEVIGAAVRTREGTRPVYISTGRTVQATAIAWTVRLGRGYRIPEPTRLAHQAAGGTLLR
ncbi:MAG: deoxyribonuclease V [Dehalococcoidia bacterium]|nr:deoxyribonuclease V [Dehalococcoidia bacterium]